MERKMESQKLSVQNLPEDMIVEILSRLPAKFLGRSRCVCKSWCDLIFPHFINKKHPNLLFLFKQHYSILDCYITTSASMKSPILEDCSTLPCSPIPSSLADAEIISVFDCDGWLLLAVCKTKNHNLFLFNPSAWEYKVFPPYGNRIHVSRSYGICYDFSDHDYKVVCIVGRVIPREKLSFTVFSFKTNSWTSSSFLPDWINYLRPQFPVPLNRALHWTVNNKNEISRFDLKDEFKQVPGPPEEIFIQNSFMLAAVRGNLCASGRNLDFTSYLVMEMKEYGVKESWTQVCSINLQRGNSMRPLAFTNKGELVAKISRVRGAELVIYNEEDNSSKTVMRMDNLKHLSEIGTYEESFVNCDCWLNR